MEKISGTQNPITDKDLRYQGRCQAWQKALLCIDLQYLNCEKDGSLFSHLQHSGISDESPEYYLDRVHQTVVPNVQKLQKFFRESRHEVIHVRIQSLTPDGRDRSLEHKELDLHAAPGSKAARFLPEVAPLDSEIVINKTASGVFVSTNLEYVLRNLCISEIFVVGVYTNECVSSAIRSACDLGFEVYLVSDATAATTRDLHEATLLTTQNRYARVLTANELLESLHRESVTKAVEK